MIFWWGLVIGLVIGSLVFVLLLGAGLKELFKDLWRR